MFEFCFCSVVVVVFWREGLVCVWGGGVGGGVSYKYGLFFIEATAVDDHSF